MTSEEDRLWSRVDQKPGEACWPWTGARDRYGYGRCTFRGRRWQTHRLVFAIMRGPIPPGKVVAHRCRNPPCCRPSHLYLTRHAATRQEAREPRREPPRRRITPLASEEIRRRAADGEGARRIGRELGIPRTTVQDVLAGRTG